MAIYHFSGQVISRSAGRSSVAAAAYRSAERLFDERAGVFHDYQSKQEDVLYKEILKPNNAPDWVLNREKLWNTVEKTEKRKDAQLAREFNIALPLEFSLEQNIELIKEYVQKEFVNRGMVADVCLHEGKSQNGERQPHAHVMLTMREINAEGFGAKARQWNSKELLLHFREAWANTVNLHLAKADLDIKIDHRTLEAQGIDLQPQNKIGPKEGRERYYQNVAEHQEIARNNGEKLYKEPEIALEAITQQQSTFTHHDLARFVNRHTADKEQFIMVYEKIKACPEIIKLGADEKGLEKYTTKEMLEVEHGLSFMAKKQVKEENHTVGKSTIKETLKKYSLTEEQTAAFNHILDKDLACVVGFAGTGKSYMLKAAREAWENEGYKVHGMTLSGIAAENLEEASGIKSHTIASRLYAWNNNNSKLNSNDILVIDEAGLVGSKDMFTIMDEVRDAKAKLVLIGDPEQLQPIQAGAAFRMIAEQCDYAQISDIRRQAVGWQREATFYLATGQTAQALDMYQKHGDIEVFATREKAMLAMVNEWKNEPDENKSQIMMAYTRKDVERLNLEARKVMKSMGVIKESFEMQTDRGKKMFAENERICFLRNDKALGVKNGTLGTIQKISGKTLLVKTDKGLISFSLEKYNHLDYGYATTVHKAQGITVDKAYILASIYYNRHAIYVAMSRHKEGVKLYWAKDDFSSFASLKNRMGVARNKDVSLDYIDIAVKYAANRDIEIDFSSMARALKETFKESITERLKPASGIQEQLTQRQREWRHNHDIKKLAEKTGKNVSFELQHGDIGRYTGFVKIGGENYGMIEQKDTVKLVETSLLFRLDCGDRVIIKQVGRQTGQPKAEIEPLTKEMLRPMSKEHKIAEQKNEMKSGQAKSGMDLDRSLQTAAKKNETAAKPQKEQVMQKRKDFEMEM